MRRRLQLVATLSTVLAFGSISHAATGKPDFGNYVGSDSLMPKPTLPASFLTLPDVSGATHTTVTMTLPGDGDDASYGIDLTGASLYGSALSNCSVNDNGFITCNGSSSFYDNQSLPDGRFGNQVVIAPFWDDLTPVAGTSSIDVWTSPGSFTIVQWTNFAMFTNPAARLTFRATFQLGAPNNQGSVVFQYLAMNGTGADGSGATIGLQRANVTAWNLYAFNTAGAVQTGTAAAGQALQAILFGYDTDGDRLSDPFETAVGSDPTKHDTDGGGLDDGAELAAGHDPTSAGDDGANTDTDGDGITDASELFYGTDPAKADTDGDSSATSSLKDNEELYTRHTNPAKADTDGDGASDSFELDNGTDPLDPSSTPPVPAINLNALNVPKSAARSTLDANGNIHIVAAATNDDAIYYYMIDQTGKVLIPETSIKLPKTGSFEVRRPVIHTSGGKVFITYELLDASTTDAYLGFVRINPAGAPQNGSAVLASQIVEVDRVVMPPSGSSRHHDMAVDGRGVHVVYTTYPTAQVRGVQPSGLTYLLLSVDGSILRSVSLPLPHKTSSTGGFHRTSMAHLAIGSDGTVYVVTLAMTKPRPSGAVLIAALNGNSVKTFAIPTDRMFERGAVTLKGNLLYLFGPAGGSGHGSLMRFGVLDLANVTATLPPANDFWQEQLRIDATSMLVPLTSLPAPSGPNAVDASLTVLPSGGVVGYYSHHGVGDICLLPVAPNGAITANTPCVAAGQNRYRSHGRGTPAMDLLQLADGSIGFVYGPNDSNLFFSKVPQVRFNFPATFPPVPSPPRITSVPQAASVRVGQTYSYAAMGTDATTPTMLTWTLTSAPSGMTVSAAGVVSWTPTAADVGNVMATLQLCNTAATPRCVSQPLPISVLPAAAPLIVSVPPTTAVANLAWSYQLAANDPQGGALTYTLVAPATPPGNMALSAGGLMTWTPTTKDIGATVVTVKVTDAQQLSDQQTFTIVVTPAADDEVQFTSVPATTAVVGTSWVYKAQAVDHGDAAATFTYSLGSGQSGNLAVAADGTVTWTPQSKEKGTVALSIVAMSSSGRMATQSFSVTVVDAAKGGCAMVPVGESSGALGLMLLAAALWLARRRRRA